jgi:hypothetical protein
VAGQEVPGEGRLPLSVSASSGASTTKITAALAGAAVRTRIAIATAARVNTVLIRFCVVIIFSC